MPSRTAFSYPIQGLQLALLVPDSGVSQSCRQAGPRPASNRLRRSAARSANSLPAPPLAEMIVVNVREWTYRLFYFPQRGALPHGTCSNWRSASDSQHDACSRGLLWRHRKARCHALNSSAPSNTPLACSTLAPPVGPLSRFAAFKRKALKRPKQC